MALISLLSGCTFDDELNVRAAAVRALAIYIMYPSLRENVCFVENTSDTVIRLLQHGSLDVRIKGSWALANISDALVANSSDTNREIVSNDLLKRLFDVSFICTGNDKIRCNAVRAIGNLLRLITEEHLRTEVWRSVAADAIVKLNENVCHRGNAKLNWNACHAVGNFMRNAAMYSPVMNLNWQVSIVGRMVLFMERKGRKVKIATRVQFTARAYRERRSHSLRSWRKLAIFFPLL